jgi:hypothetical protein
MQKKIFENKFAPIFYKNFFLNSKVLEGLKYAKKRGYQANFEKGRFSSHPTEHYKFYLPFGIKLKIFDLFLLYLTWSSLVFSFSCVRLICIV